MNEIDPVLSADASRACELVAVRAPAPRQPRQPGGAGLSAGDAVHGAGRQHPDLRSLCARLQLWSTAISACCRSGMPRCSEPAPISAASRSRISALPWFAAIALGILGGLLMAALIGVLAIRTRGIYFAMVTHGAVAMRLLPVLPGGRLDRRRERPARHQCPRHRYLRPQARFHQSADPLLRDRRLRDRGVLRAVADPGLAVRRRDRGGARERDARAGLPATT